MVRINLIIIKFKLLSFCVFCSGNVYSKEHLLDILEVAERHKLPIIADEVYEFFTFPGVQFYPLATLSKNVPILSKNNFHINP